MSGPFARLMLPEHKADPYPVYAELRRSDPVYDHDLLDGWIVTRYADVRELLRDSKRFSSDRRHSRTLSGVRNDLCPELRDLTEKEMVFQDGKRHDRVRKLVKHAFMRRRVNQMAAQIQKTVRELIAAGLAEGGMEFRAEFADLLPAITFAELMGMPREDQKMLRSWTRDLGWLATPAAFLPQPALKRIDETGRKMVDYLRALLLERRTRPRDDLITHLLDAEVDGERLDESEVIAIFTDFLLAAHETTANLLTTSALALLERPDQRRILEADPSLVGSAVEEFMRHEAPAALLLRVVVEDVELRTAHFRPGDLVALGVAAANRDPSVFSDPDRVDVTRTENRHLSFGFGAHACLGSSLARLEMQIAIRSLLRDCPEFRFADYDYRWDPVILSRGLEHLSLHFQ